MCIRDRHELAKIGRDYAGRPLGIVAISSNDAGQYPEDGPDGLRRQARQLGFSFPYCYDESQDVARAYRAACTPDFFLFDERRFRSTAVSWTAAGRRTIVRLPAPIYAAPSTRCWTENR